MTFRSILAWRPWRRLAPVLGVLGLGLALLTTTPARAADDEPAAAPALWVITDADSTLYLFGSVHVLKPDTEWRTPEIEAAFASAEDVWFELSNPDDAAAALPIIRQHGLSPDRPLSSRLDAGDVERLDAAARAIGASAALMDPMRPWFAAVNLTMAQLIKAGYQPGTGVDMILLARAREDGKTIRAFETLDQQLGLFAAMPETVEMAFLRHALDGVDQATEQVGGMVAAWRTGDAEGLERLLVAEWKTDFPDLYQTLLTDRNIDWADQIEARLEGSGVTFVTVGAGHLVGPDSVQAQLARRGVVARRLE